MSVVSATVWLLLLLLMASLRIPRACARTQTDPTPVRCPAGSDCILPCRVNRIPGVAYLLQTWYRKQESEPKLGIRAILSWDLRNNTRKEPLGGNMELLPEKGHAIRLYNVSCTDAGLYSCFLAAPLREQNQEFWLGLSVTSCAASLTPGSLMADVILAVATVVLFFSLVVFGISYVCLRNSLKDRHKSMRKNVVVTLDMPLRPLDEKDLMMIRTLGAKPPTAPLTSTSKWCWTKLVEPLSDAH